ncbi:ankyrin repeat domain-containing protein [Candidatus Parcubacteria bacterium]|nr:ankyrin repeat domain-containing protein [Candidatus Parcubacteria bacterium]
MNWQKLQNKKLIWVLVMLFILSMAIIIGFIVKKSDLENDNIPTFEEKQLVEASWICDKETVTKLLSDNKSIVDAKNEFGTTALMAVSQMGCADLVELLLEEYGANVNIENFYSRTALMLADCSSFDTIKILLSNGADVHVKNKCCGSTTLMLVSGSYDNYIDVIKLLISYGADVNTQDNEGKTAIDYAQESSNPNKKEVIQLLQKEAQQN